MMSAWIELDAEPNVGEKGFGAFRMPRRDSYRKFALEQMLDDVAAEKASPAEYGHLPSCHRSVPWPMPSCRSAASPQSGRNSRRTAGYSLCQTTSLTNRNTGFEANPVPSQFVLELILARSPA